MQLVRLFFVSKMIEGEFVHEKDGIGSSFISRLEPHPYNSLVLQLAKSSMN